MSNTTNNRPKNKIRDLLKQVFRNGSIIISTHKDELEATKGNPDLNDILFQTSIMLDGDIISTMDKNFVTNNHNRAAIRALYDLHLIKIMSRMESVHNLERLLSNLGRIVGTLLTVGSFGVGLLKDLDDDFLTFLQDFVTSPGVILPALGTLAYFARPLFIQWIKLEAGRQIRHSTKNWVGSEIEQVLTTNA